jgi:hypothetical protein
MDMRGISPWPVLIYNFNICLKGQAKKQEEIQHDSRSLDRILNPEEDQPEKGKKHSE